MIVKITKLIFALIFFVCSVKAQSEVMLHLNEKFFEAFLDALFRQNAQLEFSIAEFGEIPKSETSKFYKVGLKDSFIEPRCDEKIRLQRQIGNQKTAVYFREGKIFMPIAFTGSYNPPLIGCIDFSGIAETNLDIYFNPRTQTLLGRVTVSSVNLSGTGGIGGTLLARLVQSSIDKRINPINLLQLEKLSFTFPIDAKIEIKMKAIGVRHEIVNGGLNVFIKYQFD
jgi:hypothetical protein